MADRRGVRSSSRRITPTPQQQSQPPSSVQPVPVRQAARRNNARGTRSLSREVEGPPSTHPTPRRSARQASVESAASENGQVRQSTRLGRRANRNVAARDLTTVQEDDTQIQPEERPETPPQDEVPMALQHRSPGALSTMSGTTAITANTTLSMADAEDLDPEIVSDFLDDLYQKSSKLLGLLTPDKAKVSQKDFQAIIKGLRIPESEISRKFRVYDRHLESVLDEFRNPPMPYIRQQTVVRAVTGTDQNDGSNISAGLVWILLKANLAVLAKQLSTCDRGQKSAYDTLIGLDTLFPYLFVSSLVAEGHDRQTLNSGGSTLRAKTFDIALAMRTQLAIVLLARAQQEKESYDPDAEIANVFFTNGDTSRNLRGWDITGLGAEATDLNDFRDSIIQRIQRIRDFENTDTQDLDAGRYVDLDSLEEEFSWNNFIEQVLRWVRSRDREVEAAIGALGGVSSIAQGLQDYIQKRTPLQAGSQDSMPRGTPRGPRTSTGSAKKRRSRKSFDPNLSITDDAMAAAFAAIVAAPQATTLEEQQIEEVRPAEEDEWIQAGNDDLVDEEAFHDQVEEEAVKKHAALAAVPSSSAIEEFQKVKRMEQIEKENQQRQNDAPGLRFIDRQDNAERIEFTPEPGPSTSKGKAPQRQQKRRRVAEDEDDESDDDEFETLERDTNAQKRRKQAPVAKRAKMVVRSEEPAPPSHQVSVGEQEEDYNPGATSSSGSDGAPDMTEEPPPTSSMFSTVKKLAHKHVVKHASTKLRKGRVVYSAEEEEAILRYVDEYGLRYSMILKHDEEHDGVLSERDQIQLKDKIRNMAISYIKAGVGLPNGFEKAINPNTAKGQALLREGYTW